jgi:hypothetical protein
LGADIWFLLGRYLEAARRARKRGVALALLRLLGPCTTARKGRKVAAKMKQGGAMHSDPKFWAVAFAIWIGFILAMVNIASKVDLLMRLAG